MDWETGVQSQVESYQRLKKMVFDAALLSIQQFQVRIKGKVEQLWEWNSAFPLHLYVVAIEKGAFESPSTKVANFTYSYSISYGLNSITTVFFYKVSFDSIWRLICH